MWQDLVDCTPVSHQTDEKIGETRNKLDATKKHLRNLRTNYNGRIRSEQNARKDAVFSDHSNKEEWMRVDRKQVALNANLKRHRLFARLIDDPKIGDHLNYRADNLQIKHEKIQKYKEYLKETGTQDGFFRNNHIYTEHYREFSEEERKCKSEIQKCSRYLSIHDPNHAKKGNKMN